MKSSVLDDYDGINARRKEINPTSPIDNPIKSNTLSIQSKDEVRFVENGKTLGVTKTTIKKMVCFEFTTGKWYYWKDGGDTFYEIEPPTLT